jgi:hypothetical protein
MFNYPLKTGLICLFMGFIGIMSAYSQNGKVPALIEMDVASKRLAPEIQSMDDQIKAIEAVGGVVNNELKFRFQLFSDVKKVLDKNDIGTTTFSAVSGQSNYKLLTTDDIAYQSLLNGFWDANMTELIGLLRK